MTEIIIDGLKDHIGPGDIVGALTNEVEISGNKIGKIDFKNKVAIVEVAEEVADKVIQVMDKNQISGIKVDVELDNQFREKIKEVENYLEKYEELLQLEREEEMRQHEREIKQLSGSEREKKGRAILRLRGRDRGQGLAGKFLVKFIRQQQGEELPDNEISVGDLVMLSKNKPLNDNNPTGTVVEQSNYSITIAFDNQVNDFLLGSGLRMDLYVNDITFQRMLDALAKIRDATGRLAELKDNLLGFSELSFSDQPDVDFYNTQLNGAQQEAVKSALAADDLFLIHGPPGTGKTTTIIEILQQAIQNEERILATADSNTAVDNIVERLVNHDLEVLRVGHPVRVNPLLRKHSLDYLIEDHPKYQKAIKLKKEAYQLLDEQDEYTHPSGRWRRGMDNQQIKELAEEGQSSRGVSTEKIEEMAEWIKLQERIEQLFKEFNKLEDQAVEELINRADVVCTTNSTAGSEILAEKEFDLVVIDEATQAIEPSALIPITKGDKFVLAGDHKQLPPTILNEKAKKKGLSKSLFERLLEVYSSDIKEVLTKQYRMNEAIMSFSNNNFYAGQLEAAKQVKSWTLQDLGIDLPSGNAPEEQVLSSKKAISFLDTCGMNVTEYSPQETTSVYNQLEAELATEFIEQINRTGLELNQVAVITPYQAQVDLIQRLSKENVEINTVDSFQGREKEVVVLSLVRNNNRQDIGFLRDIRRLNVSLTRAKKKLIIIGDSDTIKRHEIYSALLSYIKNNGFYYNL